MGQIERGANRIYGVERDRPALAKYTRATLLALTAGIATLAALTLVVAGSEIGDAAKQRHRLGRTESTPHGRSAAGRWARSWSPEPSR